MQIIEHLSANNDCYKSNVNKVDSRYTNFQKNGPQGLMLHSVGCPQPSALVFAKLWNKSNYEVAVHAVLQEDGTVYQCLPWNFRGWHAGGSANNTHIGVEMTEPDCIKYVGGSNFTCSNLEKAKLQAMGTYKTAVELFAFLCKKYNLDPIKDGVIISHAEGNKRGVASAHGDPTHLWNQLNIGYTMDGFRKDVKTAMGSAYSAVTPTIPAPVDVIYRVRKSWADAKSQVGAYKNLNNAKEKCDEVGYEYSVYDPSGNVVYTPPVGFNIGDVVKVSSGAKYTNGKSVPNFVIKSKIYVRELRGDDVVISTLKTGAITGVVNKKYLTKVSGAEVFVVGDKVKAVSGAKYTSGKSVPVWVTLRTLYVREIRGNDIVVSTLKTGAVTGVISKDYLSKA